MLRPSETLYLSAVSLSEPLLLESRTSPPDKRRKALAAPLGEQIKSLFGDRIIPFDAAAAEAYAKVVIRARRHGCAISVADGQIAAIAAAHNLSVATRDQTPFQAAGLPVINPWRAKL